MKKCLYKNFCIVTLMLISFCALSACSFMPKTETLPQVTLKTRVPDVKYCAEPLPIQLLISKPDADVSLQTNRIALLYDEREVKYLKSAQWSSSAPAMMQRSISGYVNGTGCFTAVGNELSGLKSRYTLRTDLERLHLSYTSASSIPTAHIKINMQIIDTQAAQLVASDVVEVKKMASGEDLDALLDALDEVNHRAALEVARWTSETLNSELAKNGLASSEAVE